MSLTFVCVLRSGGVYSPLWVERLCRQASRQLNPTRIACLSDAMGKFRCTDFVMCQGAPLWMEPLIHDWPGWWSKIEIFRPGLFSGPCLYADLDSLILRPIPDLMGKLALWQHAVPAAGWLALLSDFYAPARPASGAMLWIPSVYTEAIYHTFARDPAKAMLTRHGDGGFIGHFPHARLQSMFPGVFGSYKAHKLYHGPQEFAHVSFHGKPKQSDLPPHSWARYLWEGC